MLAVPPLQWWRAGRCDVGGHLVDREDGQGAVQDVELRLADTSRRPIPRPCPLNTN